MCFDTQIIWLTLQSFVINFLTSIALLQVKSYVMVSLTLYSWRIFVTSLQTASTEETNGIAVCINTICAVWNRKCSSHCSYMFNYFVQRLSHTKYHYIVELSFQWIYVYIKLFCTRIMPIMIIVCNAMRCSLPCLLNTFIHNTHV